MSKKYKHIILRLSDSGLYFNADEKIPWKNTNFPDKSAFSIRQFEEIYWQVAMLRFDKTNGLLNVQVSDYNNDKKEEFLKQKSKFKVNKIEFEELHWERLKGSLTYYELNKFEESKNGFLSQTNDESENTEEAYHFEFNQAISKITFKMGYAETSKSIKGVSNKVLIKIYNPEIIPEFEYIKFYFSKIFGSRKILIKGRIGNKNDGSSYKFSSPQISQINENLINSIKRLEIKNKIRNPKVIAVDKSLFTSEEYFDGFEGEIGNNIRKSDQDLLKEILELEGIRNRKQLEYISGYLQSKKERIHFTLSPKFGFLFYVEGEDMHHFIWELLNSHATYLWSKDKSHNRANFLSLVSRKINYIRDQGRLQYINQEQNEDLIFSKINHKSAGSKLLDGFPLWRKKLNEKLV